MPGFLPGQMPDRRIEMANALIVLRQIVIMFMYMFIGFLLYRHNMDWRLAAVILVICTVVMPALTVKLAPTQVDPAGLTAYNSPLTVMQSAAVFSLMLRIKNEAGWFTANVDRCSFGIYLIHMIFIRLTMKELGFNPYDYGAAGFILAAAVYFAAAFAVTYGLKKFRAFNFL